MSADRWFAIRPDVADPGWRLKVSYDPERDGLTILSEEQVPVELTSNPITDQAIVKCSILMELEDVRWLRDQLTAILEAQSE